MRRKKAAGVLKSAVFESRAFKKYAAEKKSEQPQDETVERVQSSQIIVRLPRVSLLKIRISRPPSPAGKESSTYSSEGVGGNVISSGIEPTPQENDSIFQDPVCMSIDHEKKNGTGDPGPVLQSEPPAEESPDIANELAALSDLEKLFVSEESSGDEEITESTETLSLEFPTEDEGDISVGSVDWESLEPVISFVIEGSLQRRKPEAPLPQRRDSIDQGVFFDPRYLYFLKKVCGLSKKECVAYGKDQHRLLIDRAAKSRADVPPAKTYTIEREEGGVRIFYGNQEVFLKRTEEIGDIPLPEYKKDDFEYMVYKYGESLELISKKTGMDIRDVILIYYMKYYNVSIEMTGTLLDKYVDEEWTMNDRILFEENFTKYGTKFHKFMMDKPEHELRIYYKFYLRNYLPLNWTDRERSLFAYLVGVYKKDWNAMAQRFQDVCGEDTKDANDLRVYYGTYFKKLDEEEKMKELLLGGSVGFQGLEAARKRRGRKPTLKPDDEPVKDDLECQGDPIDQ